MFSVINTSKIKNSIFFSDKIQRYPWFSRWPKIWQRYTYIRIVCTVGGISYVPTKNRMFVYRMWGGSYIRNWIVVIRSGEFHSQIGSELHLFWWSCERLLYEYPKCSPPAARKLWKWCIFMYISILYAALKIGWFWREAPKIVYTIKSKKKTLQQTAPLQFKVCSFYFAKHSLVQ